MKAASRQLALEIGIVLAAFAIVHLASEAFQKPLSVGRGRGWDGRHYYMVAEQLADWHRPSADAPFVYRPGTPFLAARLYPADLLRSFRVVNIGGNVLTTLLLIFWFRRYIHDWRLRVLLLLLFMSHWLSPVRFVYFYPTLTDSWALAFTVAGLLVLERLERQPGWIAVLALSVIAGAGSQFRESVLLVTLCAPFTVNPFYRETSTGIPGLRWRGIPLRLLLPLLGTVAGMALTHVVAERTGGYSSLHYVIIMAYAKGLAQYLLGWFIAFGPLLVLVVYDFPRGLRFLAEHQYQAVFLGAMAVVAWIGGAETERYLSQAMPIVYVLAGRAIVAHARELKSAVLLAILAGSQAISQRLFWTTPDFPGRDAHPLPLLTPWGSDVAFFDLLSSFGDARVEFAALMQYIALATMLLAMLYRRSRRLSRAAEGELAGATRVQSRTIQPLAKI